MVEVLKAVTLVLGLFRFLGPWGVAILVGSIVTIFFLVRAFSDKIFEGVVELAARSLGKPLKDATVTVRSVTPAPEPDPSVFRTGDDEDDDAFEADLEASGMPDGDYEWYKIDAEIVPNPDAEGNPALWNPDGLGIRKDDGRSRSALDFDVDCLVAQCEVWRDGEFVVTDEHGSVLGPARIRLYVGVAPGTRNVRFWFMGELFGHVQLPTARAHATV